MQAYNVLIYQLHLYFWVFWVIIPDWQLPKFTEKTHEIAQNCVYNVQKLCAGGGGVGIRGEGLDVRMGDSAMVVGGETPVRKRNRPVITICFSVTVRLF